MPLPFKTLAIMLSFLSNTRHPDRNQLIFMLSIRAGLRAKEIACITWSMVTDAQGNVTDCIKLQNTASKGSSGGVIWLNSDLKQMLVDYRQKHKSAHSSERIIKTERGGNTTAQVVVNMFKCWYSKLGFEGCSSHSGRRTFITTASRKISTVGGSIRDVQLLARHSSLAMTQKYIDANSEAQKQVVQML